MKFMKKYEHGLTLVNFAALFSVAVCVLAGVVSYRTHTASQRAGETHMRRIDTLQRKFDGIESRLAALATDRIGSPGSTIPFPNQTATTISGKGKDIPGAAYQDELSRLKQIVKAAGLEKLTEEGDVDLSFLKDMSDRRSGMMKMMSHRRDLLTRKEELHAADAEQYDDGLSSLYQRARFQRGDDPDDEDRMEAFKEMLERYPDAYATASLIAERALHGALRRDSAQVEEYYGKLVSGEYGDFTDIITDRGVEAIPAIEHYLARQYIRDGREAEAETLIDSLEENYAASLIFTGRRGRAGAPFQPVSDIVPRLRSLLDRQP